MASAAFIDQLSADVQSFVEVLCLIHAEQRAQLFVCPCVVVAGVVGLEDHDLGVFGNSDACHFSQLQDGAAESVGVNAVSLSIEEDLCDLVGFVLVQEVATAVCEFGLDFVIDVFQDSDMLFGSADHAVIEGLGVDDGSNSGTDVAAVVDDNVTVTGANADSGGTGGVCCTNHAFAAGSQDQVNFLHQQSGQIQGGFFDPGDDVLGQTCCFSGFLHDLSCADGAVLCLGMRADDDSVSGLQGDQDLKDGGGGGVGGRNDTADNTDGGSNALGAEGLVFCDHVTWFHTCSAA